MKLPNEELYDKWRELFLNNLCDEYLTRDVIAWCDDRLDEWLDMYYRNDSWPTNRQIMQFAWAINEDLSHKEVRECAKGKED